MKHKILFTRDSIYLTGELIAHPTHRHYYIQIFVRKLLFSDKIEVEIIDSNIAHSLINLQGHYLTILLDPLSIKGKKVKEILKNRKKSRLKIENEIDVFNDSFIEDRKSLLLKSEKVLERIMNQESTPQELDNRMLKVLMIIESSSNLDLHAKDIYNKLGLSESHFHLLFKKNIGIPYRNYILFEKLKRSIISILNNKSFTFAAHEGCFSDSSHLARTFKDNTGLSLSQLFRNKRFIQVL